MSGSGAPAFEPQAQLAEVVDFSVQDDADGPVLVGDRLVPGVEIDDGKPAGADRHGVVDIFAPIVGAAVTQHVDHALQNRLSIGPRRVSEESGNPTHTMNVGAVPSGVKRVSWK